MSDPQDAVASIGSNAVFLGLFAARYARLFLSIYSFYRYKLAKTDNPTLGGKDVTIIIPTVSYSKNDNEDFEECITTCLINHPAEIIVVADNQERVDMEDSVIQAIRNAICMVTSKFVKGPVDVTDVKLNVVSADIASKRCQVAFAVPHVLTSLILFVDNHVFLPLTFINSVIPAFEDKNVGLCSTNKEVCCKEPQADTLMGQYFRAYWNVMGAVYLACYNFEICATNSLDGSVFVVLGCIQMICAKIIKDTEFTHSFKNKCFLFGLLLPNSNMHLASLVACYFFSVEPTYEENNCGLDPDDDNFITC